MDSLVVVRHPVVADKITQLRDRRTANAEFLRLAGEISRFVGYEAFRELPLTARSVDTPVSANASGERLEQEFVIVPILRAGLGMSPAMQELLPRHRLCPVGLRRNEETLRPDVYLDGLPGDLAGAPVVICDPMLATGGSLDCVATMVRERGGGPVTVVCLIAARPGVDFVLGRHRELTIVAAALDEELTDVGYITPGLGDAGDRLFGPPVR